AVHLAEQNVDARVLLGTFSPPLAQHLQVKLGRLLYAKPRLAERIDVEPLDSLATRLYRVHTGHVPRVATADEVRKLLLEAADNVGGPTFSESFLISEWDQIVDAWQLKD